MNTFALHTATEAFAGHLSEVTSGDLGFPTPCEGWDVGDLYRHVLDENARFGVAVSGALAPPDDPDGALEAAYRRTARFMETAFAEALDPGLLREVAGIIGPRSIHDLYEMQLCDTVIHTWDLTRATGFECEVDDDVADLVLRRMEQIPDTARGEGMAFAVVRAPLEPGDSTLDRIVRLSGRIPRP